MIRLLTGHVLDRLAELPPESVQCCVTSPPYYGLRDYGIEPQVWGGNPGCEHEWGNLLPPRPGRGNKPGDLSTSSLTNPERQDTVLRAQDTGAFCRRCNAWRGSLGLEPTLDLYLDHMVEVCREIRRVLRKDGTLWINIGDSYSTGNFTRQGKPRNVPQLPNDWANTELGDRGRAAHAVAVARNLGSIKAKDLMLIPARLVIRLQDDGWYVRSEIIWAKDAPMPESVGDRPTSAHEKIFLLTRSARYFYDAEAVKEESSENSHGSPNINPGDKQRALGQCSGATTLGRWDPAQQTKRNMRNVWRLPPAPFAQAHFATFPPELPRRCIKAGSKVGNTILDPFSGAGTTLLAADQLQREAIGIDLNPAYSQMAHTRIRDDAPLLTLIAAE